MNSKNDPEALVAVDGRVTRREIMIGGLRLVLVLPVIGGALAACGSSSDNDTDGGTGTGTQDAGGTGTHDAGGTGAHDAGGTDAGGTGGGALTADLMVTSSTSGGHTHTVTVPKGDVNSPSGDKTYTSSTSNQHTHTVTITMAQFVTILAGTSVTVTSSTSGGHTHSFTFHRA